MEFWKWLTLHPVAFGAVIGAGGSVVAQLIAAVVGAVIETRRANLERQDRALDRAAGERERFDASRRELFADVLQLASNLGFTLSNTPDSRSLIQVEIDLESLAQKIEVVSLLAPAVYEPAVRTHKELASTRDRLESGDSIGSPQQWWSDFRQECVNPMRQVMTETLAPPTGSIVPTKRRLWRRGPDRSGARTGPQERAEGAP
jgi:hypothetical protein